MELLYGALIGNSLSDFLGAIVDFPLMLALNITFGCFSHSDCLVYSSV